MAARRQHRKSSQSTPSARCRPMGGACHARLASPRVFRSIRESDPKGWLPALPTVRLRAPPEQLVEPWPPADHALAADATASQPLGLAGSCERQSRAAPQDAAEGVPAGERPRSASSRLARSANRTISAPKHLLDNPPYSNPADFAITVRQARAKPTQTPNRYLLDHATHSTRTRTSSETPGREARRA
jgi:hypothetical protein